MTSVAPRGRRRSLPPTAAVAVVVVVAVAVVVASLAPVAAAGNVAACVGGDKRLRKCVVDVVAPSWHARTHAGALRTRDLSLSNARADNVRLDRRELRLAVTPRDADVDNGSVWLFQSAGAVFLKRDREYTLVLDVRLDADDDAHALNLTSLTFDVVDVGNAAKTLSVRALDDDDYSRRVLYSERAQLLARAADTTPLAAGTRSWHTLRATFKACRKVKFAALALRAGFDRASATASATATTTTATTTVRVRSIKWRRGKKTAERREFDLTRAAPAANNGWNDDTLTTTTATTTNSDGATTTTATIAGLPAWSRDFVWFYLTDANFGVAPTLYGGYYYSIDVDIAEHATGALAALDDQSTLLRAVSVNAWPAFAERQSWQRHPDNSTALLVPTFNSLDAMRSAAAPSSGSSSGAGEPFIAFNSADDAPARNSYSRFSLSFTLADDVRATGAAIIVRLWFARPHEAGLTFSLRNVAIEGGPFFCRPPPVLPNARTGKLGSVALISPALAPPRSSTPSSASACAWNAPDALEWRSERGLPSAGGVDVTLPAGTTLLDGARSLDADHAPFGTVTVPLGATLVVAPDADVEWHLRRLVVEGRVVLGDEACTLPAHVHVVFHGDKAIAEFEPFPHKGVVVRGDAAVLDIAGRHTRHPWTRLARTAAAGDEWLELQAPVGTGDESAWRVGDELVVASTVFEDPERQSERVRVAELDAHSPRVVRLERALEYTHYAGDEYQAEVGNLDRSIEFSSADTERDYGAHLIVMNDAQAHIAGAEFRHMGQRNIIARYPVHLHMLGERGALSYVRESSVVDSFFRCITVHGTNSTFVEYNVATNSSGSCYYFEDGVEENNTLAFNLGVTARPIGEPARSGGQDGQTFRPIDGDGDDAVLQPADSAATLFYLTSAYNRVVGNAACGGFSGFGFVNLPEPIGLHRPLLRGDYAYFEPRTRPVLEFDQNTAHSQGVHFSQGGCIYTGGLLRFADDGRLEFNSGRHQRDTHSLERTTADGDYDDVWMNFTNVKMHLCENGGVHWGERLDMRNVEIWDVRQGAQFFGRSSLVDAIVGGHSANPNAPSVSRVGFEFYDTQVLTVLSNVEFRNFFAANDDRVFRSLVHSDRFIPDGISMTNGVHYTNCDDAIRVGHRPSTTSSSTQFSLYDWDGSLLAEHGDGARAIVGSHTSWWHDDDDCAWHDAWQVWHCPARRASDGVERWIASLTLQRTALWTPSLTNDRIAEPIGRVTMFGRADSWNALTKWSIESGVSGIANRGWHMTFDQGTPSSLRVWPSKLPADSYVVLALSYPPGTTLSVQLLDGNVYGRDHVLSTLTRASSLNALVSRETYVHDDAAGYAYFLFDAKPGAHEEYTRNNATLYDRCWWNCGDVRIVATGASCADGGACTGGPTTPPPALPTSFAGGARRRR